jgi:aryl-alcohol dehydrogenase-like predicted oxidoreductase
MTLEFAQLTPDLPTCRLLNGLWQVSGAHGQINPDAALDDMLAYHDAGYTTWDLADHYGPAEDFVGAFRARLVAEQGEAALARVQAFTKWVPNPQMRMNRETVRAAVDVSRRRMATETLDLLQFHWWEYRDRDYLNALDHLAALREAGMIRHLGLTNFDTIRLREITERGVRIVSNQVQYSIIDRRPEAQMTPYCLQHGVGLLTYGTYCGGLISAKYLGQPEPGPAALNTASLRKYKRMIDLWGGWGLFQELLGALKTVADRHGVSIPNVAVRYILDKPAVAGVIVGTRLGVSQHRDENARVFGFALDADDLARLHAVTDRSRDLLRAIGDCGDEYRR